MKEKTLVYATNINNSGETGIVAIENNIPRTYCLCNEETSNEILSMKSEIEELKNKIVSIQNQNAYLAYSNISKL